MESYTIIEEGAVFSRAQTNPRKDALLALRDKLGAKTDEEPRSDILLARMAGKAETLLAVFNDLLEQQHSFELVDRGAEAQLARADSRYNELPEGPPGRSMAMDKIRHCIAPTNSMASRVCHPHHHHAREEKPCGQTAAGGGAACHADNLGRSRLAGLE
jgi:hypothetical protein